MQVASGNEASGFKYLPICNVESNTHHAHSLESVKARVAFAWTWKGWKNKKKTEFLTEWFFSCLTAAWGCNSQGVCTIQRSIHFLYIHQSTHHLYPFILRGPRWLECLHSSEWEKAKVSFIYIYFAMLILLAPQRVCHRRNIRYPPSADILWTWLMRNGLPILFAKV